MRIDQIMIKNFRCYYGENTIDFNNEGKITLIYGDSGFGKSSFLQFLMWMFYNNPYYNSELLVLSADFVEISFYLQHLTLRLFLSRGFACRKRGFPLSYIG